MSKSQFSFFRPFAALLGIGLFAHLLLRAGPQTIWKQIHTVGWGLVLIFALGGVAHVIKTWAWRLTFRCDLSGLTWSRSIGMRLISEAIAQLGIAGKVLGEGVRVSMLGPSVPIASGISSAALDSGLYILTSATISVFGITTALLIAPLSGKWRLYSSLFGVGTLAFVGLIALAVAKRWPLLSGTTRTIGRLPWFQKWAHSKQHVIASAEERLLSFHREAPRAFWASLMLNLLCHVLAASEVYIVLRFMGMRVALIGALVLEGLTKLINTVGALNPGNVGTYEAGNMLITRVVGITNASGLVLALCRRARSMFWAGIGAVCLLVMKKVSDKNKSDSESNKAEPGSSERNIVVETTDAVRQSESLNVVIFANCERHPARFYSSLARVGTLPVLLRSILTVHGIGVERIVVCVPAASAQEFKSALSKGGRLPSSVEWREIGPDTNLWSVVPEVAATSSRIMLVMGNRTYQPRLLQCAAEWTGTGTQALATNGQFAGIHVLSKAALSVGMESRTEGDRALRTRKNSNSLEIMEVSSNSWHNIVTPEDLPAAERKLNSWLVKPTDGLFAQMNRKVSIPISRQLIKLPITANMVTMFVLAVSFSSGFFFAQGGYWSTLAGAALSVVASILDGCDGEVARLKLQSTKFGCWLETVCDYLYYLFVFGGMSLGLTRSSGTKIYLAWGGFLCFGAIMSFLVVSYARQRLSGAQPEKLLSVWQKKAEGSPSNPLLFLGRHTEFIVRRCFFPYALLFFAIIGLTKFAFIATAVGANLVWFIAMYSLVAFSQIKRSPVSDKAAAALSQQATA